MRAPIIRERGRGLCPAALLCGLLCILVLLFAVACTGESPAVGGTAAPGEGTYAQTDPEGNTVDDPEAPSATVDGSAAPAPDTDGEGTTVESPGTESATDTESEPAGEVITLAPETVPEPETDAAPMPRLDIVTEGGADVTSKDYYVRASVTLSECHESYAFADVAANIRVRGNSTAAAPKKPYRLKFDTKQEMLGLSGGRAFKNWCLMADYYDGSMLRTFGTFKFAEKLLESKYYSSDCIHVEVYLNGQYNGVYLLCEQTQINKYRINIPELVEGDTSVEQGYLFIGQGGRFDEPGNIVVYPGITVTDRNGQKMKFDAMNFALASGDYTDAQKQYASNYVSGVFKVVAHAVYDHQYYDLTREGELVRKTSFEWAKTDEEKQIETISAVFNIESAVSMCILDEIVKNLDAMTFNMYIDLSPEGDGVLTLAAPWDFDFAMANTHYDTTHSTDGFYATNLSVSEGMRTNLWYVMLGSIDWFEEMVREKWQEKFVELQTVVSEMITVNYAYDAAFNRDYDRWGRPINRALIHHHDQNDLRTFDDHFSAGRFVVNWLIKRLNWLNTQWGDGTKVDIPLIDEPPEEPPAPAGPVQLTFTSEADMALIEGIKRCTVTLTDEGLRLAPDAEARDPYFSFNYDLLADRYMAKHFPYLEFTYRIPDTASADTYLTELFLCTGSVQDATGGYSTTVEITADGKWHTVRVNLGDTAYWSGTIHEIRMDFFSACEAGDEMYLKDFKLLME